MIVMGWCGVCGTWRPVTGRGTIALHSTYKRQGWQSSKVRCVGSAQPAKLAGVQKWAAEERGKIVAAIDGHSDTIAKIRAEAVAREDAADKARDAARGDLVDLDATMAKLAKLAAKDGGK